MFDEAWEDFRAECLAEMANLQKSAILRWLEEIPFKGTVGYTYSLSSHSLTLFTTHPGILIGRGGCNIPKLEAILREEFGGEKWEVKFKEVQGGFVTKD